MCLHQLTIYVCVFVYINVKRYLDLTGHDTRVRTFTGHGSLSNESRCHVGLL